MANTNKENMAERYCALSIGIIFALIGVAGFIPSLVSLPSTGGAIPLEASSDIYAAGYGYLFGLFPINLVHNIVHVIVGVLGIVAYNSVGGARFFNRGFAISYFLIAIMGFIPVVQTTFGLMPIFGNNVWFNGLTAAIAAYFGFFQPKQEMQQMNTSPRA